MWHIVFFPFRGKSACPPRRVWMCVCLCVCIAIFFLCLRFLRRVRRRNVCCWCGESLSLSFPQCRVLSGGKGWRWFQWRGRKEIDAHTHRHICVWKKAAEGASNECCSAARLSVPEVFLFFFTIFYFSERWRRSASMRVSPFFSPRNK